MNDIRTNRYRDGHNLHLAVFLTSLFRLMSEQLLHQPQLNKITVDKNQSLFNTIAGQSGFTPKLYASHDGPRFYKTRNVWSKCDRIELRLLYYDGEAHIHPASSIAKQRYRIQFVRPPASLVRPCIRSHRAKFTHWCDTNKSCPKPGSPSSGTGQSLNVQTYTVNPVCLAPNTHCE